MKRFLSSLLNRPPSQANFFQLGAKIIPLTCYMGLKFYCWIHIFPKYGTLQFPEIWAFSVYWKWRVNGGSIGGKRIIKSAFHLRQQGRTGDSETVPALSGSRMAVCKDYTYDTSIFFFNLRYGVYSLAYCTNTRISFCSRKYKSNLYGNSFVTVNFSKFLQITPKLRQMNK